MSFLDCALEQFAREAPIAVMARALLTNVASAEVLDQLFEEHAERQYEGDLLFSSVVHLLGLVVTGSQKSVHSAFQREKEQLGVSDLPMFGGR